MLVHTLIPPVRTLPEPAVFAILDRLDEVFTDFIRGRLGVSVFARHHLSQFGLVPIGHVVFLPLVLLGLLLPFPRVLIEILLLPFPLHGQVVAEFALFPLLAVALLEKLAEDGFWVDAEGHFLHLDRFEQLGGFPLRLLRGFLFFLALGLLGVLAFLLGGFGGRGLGGELGDLFFGAAAFFVLHAEGLVLHDLGRGGFDFWGVVFFGSHG